MPWDDQLEDKINSYKPMAHKIAQKYRAGLHSKDNFEDLLQEADIAIFLALKDYDNEREKSSSESTYVYNRIKWHLYRVNLKINHSGVRPPYSMGSKDYKDDIDYTNAMGAASNIDDIDPNTMDNPVSAEDEYIAADLHKRIMEHINSKDEIVARLLRAYLKLSDESVLSIQREKFKNKHASLCYAIIKVELEELRELINDTKKDT